MKSTHHKSAVPARPSRVAKPVAPLIGRAQWAPRIGRFQTPAFFLVFFICLWRWVDVGLIYHTGGVVRGFPSFYWGWDFAHDLLRYPGGSVEYGSALLAQALYFSWLGALVLTLQAWIIQACLGNFLKKAGAGRLALISFLAPLLLLSLYARYHHASAAITALAVGWVAIDLQQRLRLGTWPNALLMLVFAFSLFVIAPPGFLLFSIGVILQNLRRRNDWLLSLLAAVALTMVPVLVGPWLFGFGPAESYQKLLPFSVDLKWPPSAEVVIVGLLYALLPLLFTVVLVAKAVHRRRSLGRPTTAPDAEPSQPASKAKPTTRAEPAIPGCLPTPGAPSSAGMGIGFQILEMGGLLLAACVAVALGYHAELKSILTADYYAWQERWPEALAAAKKAPTSLYSSVTMAQASYHLGRLTWDLPEVRTADDLVLAKEGPVADWRRSDLYYDLGYANKALHYLIESVEFWGERPALLERLAILNFALGNASTGRMYLKALLKVPFHASWARQRLLRTQTDPALEGDPEVNRLRALMLKQDSVIRVSTDQEFLSLLTADAHNQMAFEYLMTYYLLSKNLNAFLDTLPRVQDFPNFQFSPLWEEALVLGVSLTGRPVPVHGHVLSSEARSRLERIRAALKACGGDLELARKRLNSEYGNSYYFYFWVR